MDTKEDFNSKKLVVNAKQVKQAEFYKEASCLMSNGYGAESFRDKISLIGIRRQNNGRYAAQIKDPIKRKNVWLGTFDTVDEASQAYLSKKSEFEKLRQPGEKENTHIVGAHRKMSGKYTSEIINPITKERIWLGTFGNAEEASGAYQSKKLEFQKLVKAMQQQGTNMHTHSEQGYESEFEKLRQQGEKKNKHIVGAHRKISGKYTSEITNPITKKRIWLGTFDNAEEAFQAYQSKKLEFNAMQQQCTNKHSQSKQGYEHVNCEIFQTESAGGLEIDVSISNSCNGGIDQTIDSHEIGTTEETFHIAKEGSGVLNSGLMADVLGTKSSNNCNTAASFNPKAKRSFVGIKRQTNGRYAAVIKDRVKHKIWFGTFDTIEEASQAYFSKKFEFEKLNQQGNMENKSRKNCDQLQQPESPSVVASLDTSSASGKGRRIDSHKRTTHIIGAHWKKATGRYTSEIRNPISKKRIWLGSFDTAEQASHAYRSKKLEFQKLVKAKHQKCSNKQRKSKKIVNVNQGHENVNCKPFQSELAGGSPDIYVPFSNSFNGRTIQSIGSDKIGTAEEAFHAYQSKKFNSQSSKEVELQSIIPTGQENEDLWKGEWVQLPDDGAVMFSLKLGLPIIDNYGSLLGDFSTLDDLSICETEDGKHNCVLSSL